MGVLASGAIEENGKKTQYPGPIPKFPTVSAGSSMAFISMSEWVFRDSFWAYSRAGLLKARVNDSDIPNTSPIRLTSKALSLLAPEVSCCWSSCSGCSFLADLFCCCDYVCSKTRDAFIDVSVPADANFDVTFEDDLVTISTPVEFAFFLCAEHDEHEVAVDPAAAPSHSEHVFTLAGNLELAARAQVSAEGSQQRLMADLVSAVLGPVVIKKTNFSIWPLGQCLISKIAELVNTAFHSSLKPKINNVLKKGIAFEFGKGLNLKSPTLELNAGIVTLRTDFEVDVSEL